MSLSLCCEICAAAKSPAGSKNGAHSRPTRPTAVNLQPQPDSSRAMLHEILLSLSGHPSPLLRTDAPEPNVLAAISPPERQLLASTAHLSNVHVKLISYTAQIADSHPSTICRAIAIAIDSIHLAAFQRKVLEVEESILRDDPELVGAYNIVPLTAVVGEFKEWTRRMEWLWEMVQFMLVKNKQGDVCHGAQLMDRLRKELQSGYQDVVATAMSLVTVAETAWLKQVSAWILYGRLPSFGSEDFFVQRAEKSDEVRPIANRWLTNTDSWIGVSFLLQPATILCHANDGFVHALHWQVPQSHTRQKQRRLGPPRSRSTIVKAARALESNVSSKQRRVFKGDNCDSAVSLRKHTTETPPAGQGGGDATTVTRLLPSRSR